jgi:hypothetical protein
MDRKMDSGYLEPGESMEDEYDFSEALLPEEIIGIIDQLLCHEVRCHLVCSWLVVNVTDGLAYGSSSLTDNLHQSLY